MRAIRRRSIIGLLLTLATCAPSGSVLAQVGPPSPQQVLQSWYKLVLELVRHTPTYTPPVASRTFAYLGVTTHEVAAAGSTELRSLAGQLNGLMPSPSRPAGLRYDESLVLHAALAHLIRELFANTGPTGQRVIERFDARTRGEIVGALPADVVGRSEAFGQALAQHILDWSHSDGGAVIENMGFPQVYTLTPGPAHWTPTSLIALQQAPLLPNWGKNRPFAMPSGMACPLPPPPAYSEDKSSAFFAQALEVVDTKSRLTTEEKAIARFWSDDAMASPTPPGHWVSIALQIMERDGLPFDRQAETLARLGVTLADAFIGCWASKFEYDLLRPVTYIRRVIDPKWESLIITPPFPEYPSGHSTQSAAAATVLSAALGGDIAFDDATHQRDNIAPRHFKNFWAAAEEAGMSRLYGGIHFRAAIERGLEQGRCIGAFATALRTRK